jgi:hypothetical protein
LNLLLSLVITDDGQQAPFGLLAEADGLAITRPGGAGEIEFVVLVVRQTLHLATVQS